MKPLNCHFFLAIAFFAFGSLSWAAGDVACTFKSAKTTVVIKNFKTCGFLSNDPEPYLNLNWIQDDKKDPETLHSKGTCVVGAGPGVSGLPGATGLHFDFMRNGKVHRIFVHMCGEGSDNKTYKAEMVRGEYTEDPSEVKGDVFEGRCDRDPLDISKVMGCK
jgi:hypothetical protein